MYIEYHVQIMLKNLANKVFRVRYQRKLIHSVMCVMMSQLRCVSVRALVCMYVYASVFINTAR